MGEAERTREGDLRVEPINPEDIVRGKRTNPPGSLCFIFLSLLITYFEFTAVARRQGRKPLY